MLEEKRLEFERERFEEEKKSGDERLQLEKERLELEKRKSNFEQKFFNRTSGLAIPTIVSLFALLVTAVNVWVASNQKYAELSQSQKRHELDVKKMDLEMDLLTSRHNFERELSLAKFVSENYDELSTENDSVRKRAIDKIRIMFEPGVAAALFRRLELRAASEKAENDFRAARAESLRDFKKPKTEVRAKCGADVEVTCRAFGCECIDDRGCTAYDEYGNVLRTESTLCPNVR